MHVHNRLRLQPPVEALAAGALPQPVFAGGRPPNTLACIQVWHKVGQLAVIGQYAPDLQGMGQGFALLAALEPCVIDIRPAFLP